MVAAAIFSCYQLLLLSGGRRRKRKLVFVAVRAVGGAADEPTRTFRCVRYWRHLVVRPNSVTVNNLGCCPSKYKYTTFLG